MTYTEAEIARAYERGEEPHFPHATWTIVAANKWIAQKIETAA